MSATRPISGALLIALVICLAFSSACAKFDRDESRLGCGGISSGGPGLPRIIVFGEIHGTDEAPRFVANWICNLASDSSVIVGIEHPSSEQITLDHFMSTKALEPARKILAESSFWSRASQDGRTSIAMYTMLDRLRNLRQGGADVRVVAVGSSGLGGGDEITQNLKAIARYSDVNIVALLGNGHARKPGAEGMDGVSSPMFDEPYRAFAFVHTGGTAWACAPVCEMQALGVEKRGSDRIGEVVLDEKLSIYDGVVNLGLVHASSPAFTP